MAEFVGGLIVLSVHRKQSGVKATAYGGLECWLSVFLITFSQFLPAEGRPKPASFVTKF